MLSVSEAETIIFNLVQPLNGQRDTEAVGLLTAIDRILAVPVTSSLDFPHWNNSAMDGYAVRYEDVKRCSKNQPARLEIVEEIPAGREPKRTIKSGQAARIFTGAIMPPGADTVIMQEQTQREQNQVLILAAPKKPQEFVRQQAAFYQAGTTLLPQGIMLNAAEIGVLAAAQCTQMTVYRRPRVAILSTGNELATPDQVLKPGQIVDSNQYALAALVAQTGAEPLQLGIIPDNLQALRSAISKAAQSCDLVISSGGVSVGDYDYIKQILTQLGATIHIRAVAVKPGKPLTVATFPGSSTSNQSVIYFGLPGNPVSALVSYWRFVQPALKKLSGLSHSWGPSFVKAENIHELRSDGQRETYLWGQLHLVNGTYKFHLASGSHNSANLINLAQTNGLAVVPIGQTSIPRGQQIQVLQISPAYTQISEVQSPPG